MDDMHSTDGDELLNYVLTHDKAAYMWNAACLTQCKRISTCSVFQFFEDWIRPFLLLFFSEPVDAAIDTVNSGSSDMAHYDNIYMMNNNDY
jgi:hypothetical protein